MRYIVIDFDMFTPLCGSIRWSEKIVHQLLELMAYANLQFLKCKGAPLLYDAGVVYKREPVGREEFKAIPAILRDGHADCEDLAAYRVAELRNQGEDAKFMTKKWVKPGNFYLYHILVMRGDGTVEDPSRILGMGSDKDA